MNTYAIYMMKIIRLLMNIVKNIILIIIFKVFDFIFQTIKAIKYNNFISFLIIIFFLCAHHIDKLCRIHEMFAYVYTTFIWFL